MKDSYKPNLNPADSTCACSNIMDNICAKHPINNEKSSDDNKAIDLPSNKLYQNLTLSPNQAINAKNEIKKDIQSIMNEIQNEYKIFVEGHTNYVKALVMTSDNKYIISGSSDNTIRIWYFLTKHQVGILRGHTDGIETIAITSNNKYIISGSLDKTIRIWNLSKQKQKFVLNGHSGSVQTLVVISDDKYIISGSFDKTIRIWNILEKKLETILNGHKFCIKSLVVTSDSKFIISISGDFTMRIWNILEKKTRDDIR